MTQRLCSCRGTVAGEVPRPYCAVVLAWMDGDRHAAGRCRCKRGLPYDETTEAAAFKARKLPVPEGLSS
jgi:hypothetical protein